ncbi:MAG: ATP-dependent helicase, partial [Spirochaetota bacterium]
MLNKEQHLASRPDTGYSLILAGAGTGKTTTLVTKVCEVISSGIASADQIMLLTFSRAAAMEMKERITAKAEKADLICAGTFHSVALSILKKYPAQWSSRCGYTDPPAVIDDSTREKALHDMILQRKEAFLGVPASSVAWLCGKSVSEKYSSLSGFSLIQDALARLKTDFSIWKQEQGLCDFDDIILHCTQLLRSDTKIKEEILSAYRYIFIDEFQDIADDTLAFVRELLPYEGGNLCAVGDDAQAIYSFMGSTPRHIASFRTYFPGARIYRLQSNYRSRKEIVSLSNSIIALNNSGMRKKLISVRGRGGCFSLHAASDAAQEFVLIEKLISQESASREICLLLRSNWQIELFRKSRAAECPNLIVQTVHASKGLEYETVIVAGVEDGIFPSFCSDTEEERRLFYVALTRAKDRLHI